MRGFPRLHLMLTLIPAHAPHLERSVHLPIHHRLGLHKRSLLALQFLQPSADDLHLVPLTLSALLQPLCHIAGPLP